MKQAKLSPETEAKVESTSAKLFDLAAIAASTLILTIWFDFVPSFLVASVVVIVSSISDTTPMVRSQQALADAIAGFDSRSLDIFVEEVRRMKEELKRFNDSDRL